MVKKLRIQKLDENGVTIEDRLVDQTNEFYIGPKDKHLGPLKIELCLFNPEDVESSIAYLLKLKGDLPIETKTVETRGRKRTESTVYSNVSREQALKESLEAAKDQDDFITKLRELGFVFVESDRLQTLLPENYKIKQRHLEHYQWMIKVIKTAKDPRNDKFDPSLLVGIHIMYKDNRSDKMVVYLNGEMDSTIKKELPSEKKMFDFLKTNLIKYPHYMTYEERDKWGIEHRLLLNNPEKQPSKFYQRWEKDVTVGEELQITKQ